MFFFVAIKCRLSCSMKVLNRIRTGTKCLIWKKAESALILFFSQSTYLLCFWQFLLCNLSILSLSLNPVSQRIRSQRHLSLSVCRSLLVLRVWHGEKVLQLPLESLKRRSLHGIFVPALKHDVVQWRWTALWRLHPVAVLHLVQNFCICHSWQMKFVKLCLNIWSN